MKSGNRRRGGSTLELALCLPWVIFLFVGVYDWGYYAHALISTENAARVAALYTSTSTSTAADAATACTYAIEELRIISNVGSSVTTCGGLPVIVTAVKKTGADGNPASEVAVTYQTNQLIPIPGMLTRQTTFYRVVQMRLRDN